MKRALTLMFVVACGSAPSSAGAPDGGDGPDSPATPDAPEATGCPAGKAGAACILALYDASSCDDLTTELDARKELGPLWAGGRALFRTDGPRHIAGSFNQWDPAALATAPRCGMNLAVADVATGAWAYKLVENDTWSLDPHDPAFVYDDYEGNADGENSALVTPDAATGQLVHLHEVCSQALGNCRGVDAYLPPHYDLDQQTYPVVFMHDGQNIFDDHDCCFGHTGWEVNVAMDAELAAGHVAPAILIGAYNTSDRNDEYGLDATKLAAFLNFQVTELQPAALAQVRWDHERVAVAGSSLGGLVSMELGLAHPETYRAVASLSGAFWPGMDEGTALRDKLAGYGKSDVAIYLDHGGEVDDNSDGAADSVEVRDRLVGMGWHVDGSPDCTTTGSTVCYFHQPGATHDELAWKARTWRFLRFVLPPGA